MRINIDHMLCGTPAYGVSILWGRSNRKAHRLQRPATVDDWLLVGVADGGCRVAGTLHQAPCALLVPPRTMTVSLPAGASWECLTFDVARVSLRHKEHEPHRAGWVHVDDAPQPGPEATWGVELPRVVPATGRTRALTCLRYCIGLWWRGPRAWARANARLQDWLTDYACGGAMAADNEHRPAWLQQMDDVLDTHLQAGVTLATVAALLRMSSATLHRRCHRELGESPGTYLLRFRLERAAHLLDTTDRPIARIAAAVGYRSRTTFAAQFRRHYGVAPMDYRAGRQ